MTDRTIHVFASHGFWGRGVRQAVYRMASHWPAQGHPARIYTAVAVRPDPAGIFAPAVPMWLPQRARAWIGSIRRLEVPLERRAERLGLGAVGPGDVCHVWPGVDTGAIAAMKAKGATVVLEFINTHVRYAKAILDAECDRVGAPRYPHFTPEKIAEEDARLALGDFVFAPGPFVGESIRECGATVPQILDTSYGAYRPKEPPPDRTGGRGKPMRFLFAGLVGVRKGMPTLLEAWRRAALPAELVVAGRPEPFIGRRYVRDDIPGIRFLGQQRDMARVYREADVFVFPSLEEGDPQVAHEAAMHGLPLVATRMGGGRVARDGRNALIVPPSDADALAAALTRMFEDAGLRRELSAHAAEDAAEFEWSRVADRRRRMLADLMG